MQEYPGLNSVWSNGGQTLIFSVLESNTHQSYPAKQMVRNVWRCNATRFGRPDQKEWGGKLSCALNIKHNFGPMGVRCNRMPFN